MYQPRPKTRSWLSFAPTLAMWGLSLYFLLIAIVTVLSAG